MTIETMRWHEAVNVHYDRDFRRQSLVALVRNDVIGPRVLDMRCITGSLAVELAAAGMEVVALDGYEGAVHRTNELARTRGVHTPLAQLWDLTGLVERVGERRFETVLCLDVLNHVKDDHKTVAEISRVLVEHGRLILVVPAFPALLGKRDRSLGHLRRYTKSGLRYLLERHGLTVQSLRYWNFTALPLFALIERGLRARLSDQFRYGWWGFFGSLPNRLLGWWYGVVENRLRFPCGLSLVAIAHKGHGSPSVRKP